MKKIFGPAALGLFFLLSSAVDAGHDFMNEVQKALTLIKEDSCSNGKTKIEHRRINTKNIKMSMVLVMLEPDATSKKSEFYRETNKGFYSLIFYKLVDDKTLDVSHMIKRVQSGNLEKLDFPQWLQELQKADPSAAKSLMNQPGSDCSTTYQIPSP